MFYQKSVIFVLNLKHLQTTEFVSTDAISGACDKFEVWSQPALNSYFMQELWWKQNKGMFGGSKTLCEMLLMW